MNVADIVSGKYDNELDSLLDAIRRRSKVLRQQERDMNLVTISAGDKVRLKNITPKYLAGTVATVTGKKTSRFVVDMPTRSSLRKWSGRTGVTVPASSVERVSNG